MQPETEGSMRVRFPSPAFLAGLSRRAIEQNELAPFVGDPAELARSLAVLVPSNVSPYLDCAWLALGTTETWQFIEQPLERVVAQLSAGGELRRVAEGPLAVARPALADVGLRPGDPLVAVFVGEQAEQPVLHFAVSHVDGRSAVPEYWVSKCGKDRRAPIVAHTLEQIEGGPKYGRLGAVLLGDPALCEAPGWSASPDF